MQRFNMAISGRLKRQFVISKYDRIAFTASVLARSADICRVAIRPTKPR
jgi:hypothetical protein